jgi:hypothetical protein
MPSYQSIGFVRLLLPVVVSSMAIEQAEHFNLFLQRIVQSQERNKDQRRFSLIYGKSTGFLGRVEVLLQSEMP